MDIWRSDYWQKNKHIYKDGRRRGLYFRFEKETNQKVRNVCIEFGKWLRREFCFPIKVVIYFKNTSYIKASDGELVSAIFFGPLSKLEEPYIKIATGDYNKINDETRKYNMLAGIFCSIAHELTHYYQWINDIKLTDRGYEYQARYYANKIVGEYIENREYDLQNVETSSIKFLRVAEKYLEKNNFEKAIQYYITAIEIGADDYRVYNDIAYCYDNLADYERANLYYDKAININSENPDLLMNKGYALHYLKQYEEAIQFFDKSIEIEASKEAYVFKAYLLEELRDYENALISYDMAIKLDSNYDIAYNCKGQLLCNVGKLEEAKECCSNAILISDNYADAYYNLAVIYMKMGEVNEARNSLNKAIKIDKLYKKYAIEDGIFDISTSST